MSIEQSTNASRKVESCKQAVFVAIGSVEAWLDVSVIIHRGISLCVTQLLRGLVQVVAVLVYKQCSKMLASGMEMGKWTTSKCMSCLMHWTSPDQCGAWIVGLKSSQSPGDSSC